MHLVFPGEQPKLLPDHAGIPAPAGLAKLKLAGFTRLMFLDLCVLAGCDYLKFPGIGFSKLVTKYCVGGGGTGDLLSGIKYVFRCLLVTFAFAFPLAFVCLFVGLLLFLGFVFALGFAFCFFLYN